MLIDACPMTPGHDVARYFHLPVLIAFWVMYPVPLQSLYIYRTEYATRQDDTETTASNMQATLSWAVKFRTSSHRKTVDRTESNEIAEQIAKDVGLLNHGQVGELLNHYLLVHSSYNETLNTTTNGQTTLRKIQDETETKLRNHPDVEWFHQQRIRRRTKRSFEFKDPSYSLQWHLHNHKTSGMDINVTEVWNHNITGRGVVVAVIDDGLEWKNEDIFANYNAKGSWDLNSNDPDPMPEIHKGDGKSLNRHGTRCAGEIAAVANDKCSVGVAFNAQISGIRLLDGPMTDSLEATAFNKNMHINDIYSCSWGPDDDGKTVDGPHPLAQAALKHGVTAGRKGLGSIFVVASGNGGRNADNCNYDGYANSMYTVTIGAVDESGQMPYYAEQCASMLAVTFSSGASNRRSIVTTDWTLAKGTGCTTSHTGTSAAAPLAAGMIALMLQAKPCLTWRDIQHLIIYTAVKIDERNAVWITNAGGFHHSHKHGFGLMSAWRLVNAAKAWHTVPWLTSISCDAATVNRPILAGKTLTVTHKVSNSTAEHSELRSLEHVLVTVSLSHAKRGLLRIELVCPSGTESVIGANRKKDESSDGLKSWTFSTVRCWGENPVGEWKLVITDGHPGNFNSLRVHKGKLITWKLTLYGSSMTKKEIEKRKTLVAEAMSGIFLDANLSEPCSYYWNVGYEEESFLSAKAMEILLYVSGMFTLLAIYYTLEQAFCNKEDKEREKDAELGENDENVTTLSPGRYEERRLLLDEVELDDVSGHPGGRCNLIDDGPQVRHTGGNHEEQRHLLDEVELDEVCGHPGRHAGGKCSLIDDGPQVRHTGGNQEEQRHLLDEVEPDEVCGHPGRHPGGGCSLIDDGPQVRHGGEYYKESSRICETHLGRDPRRDTKADVNLTQKNWNERQMGDGEAQTHREKDEAHPGYGNCDAEYRDCGDGASNHGTPRQCPRDHKDRTDHVICTCKVDTRTHNEFSSQSLISSNSIHAYCPMCNKVQYNNTPISSFQSKFRDLDEIVPVAEHVPSQHALLQTQLSKDNLNFVLTNIECSPQDSTLIGLDVQTPSSQTAGQFNKSRITNKVGHEFFTSHPLAGTNRTQTFPEPSCSLVASKEDSITQPIPSILLQSAMSESDKHSTRNDLIGQYAGDC